MAKPYYKSRVVYPNRKKEARRRVFAFAFLVFGVFALVGLLGFGLYSFAHLEKFRIKNISVEGTRALSQEEIRASAFRALGGSVAFVIPGNNWFAASSRHVAEALQKEFPRIRSVLVKKSFPDGMKISVEERTEWGVYCRKISNLKSQISNQDTMDATTSAQMTIDEEKSVCGYIDRDGVLFGYPLEIFGTLLPVILDDSSAEIREGDAVASRDALSFFETARDQAKREFSVAFTGLEILKELPDDYRLRTREGWYVLVPRAGDQTFWLSPLKALLEHELQNRPGLEYIDVRFGNKMFYKRKN